MKIRDSRISHEPTPVAAAPDATIDLVAVQRRTLRLLFVVQIVSGIGIAIGSSVGALLVAELAGVGASGLAQSAAVVGAALLAVPATAIVHRRGRRPSLAAAYLVAAVGSIAVVVAAVRESIPLIFVGFFLFGGATAAGLQARYAAVDLAPAALRGRHLSVIVWATTLGAVAGPNLAAVAGASLDRYGIPTLAGPFVFSSLLFGLAAAALVLAMRPDPGILARRADARSTGSAPHPKDAGMRAALRAVAANPSARLGVAAMAVGHLVMVGVMAMTPVHIRDAGHDAAHTLRIVGVVLSVHIAGMYAFAPVIGWLTDRFGRRPVILAGVAFLVAACTLAGRAGGRPGTAGHRTDGARYRLVIHDGGGVHAAQRIGVRGAADIGSGSFRRHDGTRRCIGRRAVGRGRAGLGIPDPGADRGARDCAAHRARDPEASRGGVGEAPVEDRVAEKAPPPSSIIPDKPNRCVSGRVEDASLSHRSKIVRY